MKFLVVGDAGSGKNSWVKTMTTGQYLSNAENKEEKTSLVRSSCVYKTNYGEIMCEFASTSSEAVLRENNFSPDVILIFSEYSENCDRGLEKWLNVAREKYGLPVILCGSKVDLRMGDEFDYIPPSIKLPMEKNLHFFALSARSQYNCEKPILFGLRMAMNKEDLSFIEVAL